MTEPTGKKSPLPWYIALAVTALAIGVWLSAQNSGPRAPEPFDGGVMLPPKPLPPLALTDHHGAPFTKADLEGRWTFVFFGYTYCPDICPTTLQLFAQVRDILGKTPDGLNNVAFVFQSVDPARDDPARLREYVTYFHPDFLGVTGEPQAIETYARAVGAVYLRVSGDGRDEDNYLMDHSSAVFLLGPDARLHGVFTAPHDPTKVAAGLLRFKQTRGH